MAEVAVKKKARAKGAPDAIAAAAVEVARAGLLEVVDASQVGEHLGVSAEGDRLVSHRFAALHDGYVGWHWVVLVARASRAKVATVCDSWLEPGEGSLLAPEWLPWADRLRPEDVGATDRLAYVHDDVRLMPGYEATDDADADHFALWELGLGRPRVMSPEGRSDAVRRWLGGAHGPDTRAAHRAEACCYSCGFFVPLPGSLRQVMGVCANEWSAADGNVVAALYGCGAHSETDIAATTETVADPVLDEAGYDLIDD